MSENKKEKKIKMCCPDLKTASREHKDKFIGILDYYIGLREEEIELENKVLVS